MVVHKSVVRGNTCMAKPDQLFGGARSALCEFFSLTFYLGNSKQFSYGLGLECPLFFVFFPKSESKAHVSHP